MCLAPFEQGPVFHLAAKSSYQRFLRALDSQMVMCLFLAVLRTRLCQAAASSNVFQ